MIGVGKRSIKAQRRRLACKRSSSGYGIPVCVCCSDLAGQRRRRTPRSQAGVDCKRVGPLSRERSHSPGSGACIKAGAQATARQQRYAACPQERSPLIPCHHTLNGSLKAEGVSGRRASTAQQRRLQQPKRHLLGSSAAAAGQPPEREVLPPIDEAAGQQ